MPGRPAPPSREERLATKLRENLRRRKQQAREIASDEKTGEENAALPKGGVDG